MDIRPDFESVVRLYEPLIKKFLSTFHLLYDYEEYQQIALIALWEAYHQYDPDKGPFPAYASSTVRGRLLSEIKRRKKFSDVHEFVDDIQIIKDADKHFEHSSLEGHLMSLSKREKEWVEATFIHDLSTKQIAEKYHVSQDTVRSWKKGVIKKLRIKWGVTKS